MLVNLPCIAYRSYNRSSRRKLEFGWVLSRLQVVIHEVAVGDAPLALRFWDHHGQGWDVRHHAGHFYVQTGYDGLPDARPVTSNDLAAGNPEKARGMAMMLRSLMGARGSNFGYEECVALFENWHDIPVEQGELRGHGIVDVDKVPNLQVSGSVSGFEDRVRSAYESAIIVEGEVFRRCEEPHFVLSFEEEYDPDRLIVRVNVFVEPYVQGQLSGVRAEAYPHEAWERPTLRIDRHDDLEDLIDLYTRPRSDVVAMIPEAPKVIIDPLFLYSDEVDMLQRTATGVLSEGHSELLWVSTDRIHQWARLKDAISAVQGTFEHHAMEELNASLKAYGDTLDDEVRIAIIKNASERFDMRPVRK